MCREIAPSRNSPVLDYSTSYQPAFLNLIMKKSFVSFLFWVVCCRLVVSSPLLYERQSSLTNDSCITQSDCLPNQLLNGSVASPLVSCSNGVCLCTSCFMKNESSNTCYVQPPCTDYNTITSSCVDTRQSQLTAFLLSLFLSWTGAANFYINQLALAIPQLLIGILACCLGIVMRIVRSVCCNKDGEDQNIFQLLCFCAVCLPVLIIPLIQLAWWIADLVIFVRNERLDGRGCPLIANL